MPLQDQDEDNLLGQDEMPLNADTIAELATAPKRTKTAEGMVEERSIDELIKADQYTNSNPNAVPWGMRIARVRPGSTTAGHGNP